MIHPVSTFTPIQTESKFSMLPALYLSPLTCNREIAIFKSIDAEGNQICTRATNNTTFTATALKIATYILSVGILPLLAFVLNLAIRCGSNYQYDEVEQRQPDLSIPNPAGPRLGQNQPLANEFDQRFENAVADYMKGDLDALQAGLLGVEPDDNFNKNAIEEAIHRKRSGMAAPVTPPPTQEPVNDLLVQSFLGISVEDLLEMRDALSPSEQRAVNEAIRRKQGGTPAPVTAHVQDFIPDLPPTPTQEHVNEQLVNAYWEMPVETLEQIRSGLDREEQRAIDEVIIRKRDLRKAEGNSGVLLPAPGTEKNQNETNKAKFMQLAADNNYYELVNSGIDALRTKYFEELVKYDAEIIANQPGRANNHWDNMQALEMLVKEQGESLEPEIKAATAVPPAPVPTVAAAPQTPSPVTLTQPVEVAAVILPPMDPEEIKAKRLAKFGGSMLLPGSAIIIENPATVSTVAPQPTQSINPAAPTIAPAPSVKTSSPKTTPADLPKGDHTSLSARAKALPPAPIQNSINLFAINKEEWEKNNAKTEQLKTKLMKWTFMTENPTPPSVASSPPKSIAAVQTTELATSPILTPASPEAPETKMADTIAAAPVGSVLGALNKTQAAQTSIVDLSKPADADKKENSDNFNVVGSSKPADTDREKNIVAKPIEKAFPISAPISPSKTAAEDLGFDPRLLRDEAKKRNRKNAPIASLVPQAPAIIKEKTTPPAAKPVDQPQQNKNLGNLFLEGARRRKEKTALKLEEQTPKSSVITSID